MSTYPAYEPPIWASQAQSRLPYSPYPTHTTLIHSTAPPVPDADIYRVGIYGWRKRCLYLFILILTIIVVLNLALTIFIMSVIDFSTDGLGPLTIEDEGIRVRGKSHFDQPVHLGHLTTARDEALSIDAFGGVRIQSRNSSGHLLSHLALGPQGKAQAVCDRFEILDRDHKLLFFVDSKEIGLKLENLRILDEGGSVFEGAIQTGIVRPEADSALRLESPTRTVTVEAAQDIELSAAAGEIQLQSLLDISLLAKQGEIRLESANIFADANYQTMCRELFILALISNLAAIAFSASCVDGKNNLVSIVDIGDANLNIHIDNGVGATYDKNMKPSCKDGYSQVTLPGFLKLVSGTLRITAASDLMHSGQGLLTLKKDSLLVGTVCENGKSKSAFVKNEECKENIVDLLGPDFTQLLDTPGTYDLAEIEKMANLTSNIIPLKPLSVSGGLKGIVDGEWQISLNTQSNGKTVANFKIPGNEKWVYLHDA
ncbi:hypothetical protein WR25_03883 [Diploscapter pachys]|uniref:Gamma-sarcoglycan n=1 Tax=Diploscapter pachys TaxID=2018661 RepID=A0A2A2JMW0_9BILA|nr:hypothetical protein WR25_03883 [Diploscapter pachys]